MTADTRTIAGIPVLHFTPEGTETKLPTVLLYHGWGGTVEHYRFFGTMLSQFGFQVIVPEIPLHGERGALANYYSPEGFARFWEVICKGVHEGKELIGELTASGMVDPKRLGIVGHSLGGGIASGLFAHSEAAALVTINGASAYEFAEVMWRKVDGRSAATDAELQPLRELDPVRFAEQIAPRPVLFLHGDADTQVPLPVGETLHAALKPYYAEQPELLHFETSARLDHFITLGMLEETVNWLKKHIANPR
ncbi:hypothetical protein CBW65_22880 [Tumebacillus avium]|uniref:Dienelactone hydrolase domain-containing protein n=1 Tax=Tumebacillus avium TaxID=1903704 RepID=A0A1Y0ISB2_9BACL|nr:alpha/beta fold hydrolase [Tumebacillus avium]ARU63532.1 hypothetical protein CBW65_22880 [Tumebacillus avium]